MFPKTAVLIPSCDKYADLWHPFFQLFWRKWPDCPYPVFLGSNERSYSDKRIKCLRVGQDKTWCANLQAFLDRIDARHLILFLDDFLLIRPIATAAVDQMTRLVVEHNLGCLRLRPAPPPSKPVRGLPHVGVVLRGEPYRVSTQVAIWDVAFLRKIAQSEFNIWEFEHYGTLIADRLPGEVWAVYDSVTDYRHGVERGRWMEEGLAICRNEGIILDLTKRDVITKEELRQKRHNLNKGIKPWLASRVHPAIRRFVRRNLPRPKLREYLVDQMKH